MKFTVQRDDFHQAVSSVQRATATRVIQPILSNILIETLDNGFLKLSATDLDFAIETTVAAEVQQPGRITVSAKKLAEITSKLPPKATVLFDVETAAQTARIESGSSLFDIRTMPAEEFPMIKKIDQDSFLEVDLKSLCRAVTQTAFAAASYETNNVLGGVYFQLTPDNLEMAATDGSRLARRLETVPIDKANQKTSQIKEDVAAIIPVKALQEFVKLASYKDGANDETVRIAIQDGQISLRTSRFYVLSRLLDGQYPKYQQLIPNENKIVAYANKQAMIDSLERAAVMANERTNVVKLSLNKNNMSLAAQTPDLGDSKDTIDIRYDGEPLSIAFNYKYLLDALRVIESDDVRMETNGALAPTLFKSGEENSYLCLVMPVQVK
ncbi:MAG: DNA polymerase III subunit beta [Cyanobacteria bacterium]|nr:DNA polymerase III subunit beta [Cyanobacteriota bacterium]